MSNTMMSFPDTIEEYMEIYKIVDSDEVYTNGVELVPVFRIKQWLKAHPNTVEVVRCKDCKHYKTMFCKMDIWHKDITLYRADENDFCSYGERKDG